jgi:hypothetical protein
LHNGILAKWSEAFLITPQDAAELGKAVAHWASYHSIAVSDEKRALYVMLGMAFMIEGPRTWRALAERAEAKKAALNGQTPLPQTGFAVPSDMAGLHH